MNGPKRVLVVDDEKGVRTTLAANLELEGYEVVEAESGFRAVELAKERPFEVVITDMRMPGMNGLETFREIRKVRPDTAVVLMTGFALEKLLEEGVNEGAYAVLQKPFSMDLAAKVVARAALSQLVLVVDDAPMIADTLASALGAAGLRAESVHDGESAVEVVRERDVDVCVLDLVMPGKDGLAACEEILAAKPDTVIIAMTAHSAERLIAAVLDKGGYACLRKPFSVTDLIQTIARARAAAGSETR
jgi:two-component system, NtrC family, response regulator HydG